VITLTQYFGKKFDHPDATAERKANASSLLLRVRDLLVDARAAGVPTYRIDPDTGTSISGAKGGDGDGGFRLQSSKTGAPNSTHKNGQAVDVYDPDNELDKWLDQFETGNGGNSMLIKHGLYREHGDDTPGWAHLQNKPPASGKRTYRAK
jgi:hypothetical protein